MKINSSFKAAWWLGNAHAQTLWPALFRQPAPLNLIPERVELADGDFIDLAWIGTGDGPIVLVLHGLGGSIDSSYAQWIMHAITQQGWRGVLMHFRGCSGTPNRLKRGYHSGETADVQFIAEHINKRHPQIPLVAIGYSLGGNVLLKWLGESQHNNPLHAAIAVSVPFRLSMAATQMTRGLARIYQWHLLKTLKSGLTHKIPQHPDFSWPTLSSLSSFWEFDNKITAPLHGFADVHDYYLQSSSHQYLKNICKPTLIIHSQDDPLMTPTVIPSLSDLSTDITLELTEKGGHVGFISGNTPGRPHYWLEPRCINYFKAILAE